MHHVEVIDSQTHRTVCKKYLNRISTTLETLVSAYKVLPKIIPFNVTALYIINRSFTFAVIINVGTNNAT